MVLDEFDIFNSVPWKASETAGTSIDANYCLADVGKTYALYLPSGRSAVHLDPWVYVKKVSVQWLDIANLKWTEKEIMEPNWDQFDGFDWYGPKRILTIAPPDHKSYMVVIRVLE